MITLLPRDTGVPVKLARPGVTLIELLVFVAIFAVVGFTVLPLLFSATENRLLQQTVSLVEQNGLQVLQQIGRLAAAERILDPPPQEEGIVLTLQSGSGAMNPTIIGALSGSLVVIRRATKQVITSPQVALDEFRVWNTSASTLLQSFRVSFRVSRAIRLQAPHIYERTFEGTFTLPPGDEPRGAACGGAVCSAPSCAGMIYTWKVCQSFMCSDAQTYLPCSASSSSTSSSSS
ncbi:MAG: type II secretion system protein [Candidatus Peribacteraceae bacterium]|jgi:type II secretory pathway pseudopilin PulG